MYSHLVTEYFAEPSYIFTGKAGIHFAVFAKFTVHQIIRRFNADDTSDKAATDKYVAGYICCEFSKGFNIALPDPVSTVQPVAINCVVGPSVQLPFGNTCFSAHDASG